MATALIGIALLVMFGAFVWCIATEARKGSVCDHSAFKQVRHPSGRVNVCASCGKALGRV